MITESTNSDILYQGNSTITVETLPDYVQPVVVKKPASRHSSQRNLRILENEHQMTRALNAVDGVRKALGKMSIENQPALILEYLAGEPLRENIERKELDLRSKLEIAVDLARILGEIHQQDVIHLDFNSKNILVGEDQGAVHIIDLGSASYIDRSGYQKVRPDQLLAAWPTGEDYEALKELGVRLVINMDWVPADEKLSQPPLRVLALTEIDTPLTPMSMKNIWKGVGFAQEVFDEGDVVMVYCKGGVHRSVVMACCILISQGYNAEKAMALVKERRPVADPYSDHYKSRILKFEGEWDANNVG